MSRKKKGKEKFVGIFSEMYTSKAFKGLSANSVRLLIELKWRFNGYNNGTISISIKEIRTFCNIGSDNAVKAILQLLRHGFIKIRKIGQFTTNKASEYELTFENLGNDKPHNDWRYFPDNNGNKIEGKNLNEYHKNLCEYLAKKNKRIN